MKKCNLAPLASLLLALSLVACGGSGSQEPAQPAAEESEASAQATDEGTSEDKGAADDTSATDAAEEKEDEAAEGATTSDDAGDEAPAEEEEEPFERGVIEGDTYLNAFFGIKYTLPEGYQFATDEQLAQLANTTQDMLEDEAVLDALDSGRVIYDMYAYGPDGQSVNISIEKVNAMAGAFVNEESYRDICVDNLEGQLSGSGMEVTDQQNATQTVGATEHPAVNLTLSYEDMTIYEKLVFIKGGTYFALVTSGDTTPEGAEALLGQLSEI